MNPSTDSLENWPDVSDDGARDERPKQSVSACGDNRTAPGTLEVTDVRFTSARSSESETGLLGYITCSVNDTLHLDGIALRRTADGRLTLSFPSRKDSSGRQHFFIRPLDDRARREVEHQIFRALALTEDPFA